MAENLSTYRIRTKVGETKPINIPVSLMQEYNSFEILSLKINTNENYRSYTSNEGIVVGRVTTQNNGLGIPNVRVSIFVPKGTYSQTDEEEVLYPFSSPTDIDGDRVRYNLLPSDSDVECYQVIGTLPTKRKILDNETVCEVFDKYYKYTTCTNESGDFMLTNIPCGKQRIHIDADLSDIGSFLSQKPYNMIENLGFEKNKFNSTRQFKTSKDLDSLAQVISQNKSVYVYPYWGDATENSSEMKITRTDLSLNYEFKTMAIFMGSIISDKKSNSIRENCTATEHNGKMSDLVTGPGKINMIRKTIDNKIEQYQIKGDALIDDNGVWCYSIPMNLDYVKTDEYGNIVPTDDPNKGIPTRARVRFRITMNGMESDNDSHKRCSYLIPNNPNINGEKFLKENDCDYSFGSDTWDESFVDLFWNKVYTVKSYIPRLQKGLNQTNRKHTGIKMVNHYGDNNPFPYNGMTIKLPFQYRLICVIVKIFIDLIWFINTLLSLASTPFCVLCGLLKPLAKLWLIGKLVKPLKNAFCGLMFGCIKLSSEFCDDGISKNVTFPGCTGCNWDDKVKPNCEKSELNNKEQGEEDAVCTNKTEELENCVEQQLAQSNEAVSFNFSNDWINGCLYMPLWYRKITPKKKFFFGLFKKRAKDQWCSSNHKSNELKLATFCSVGNSGTIEANDYKGKKITYHKTQKSDNSGNKRHESRTYVGIDSGVIINKENMLGQTVWYYKAAEVVSTLGGNIANEYLDSKGEPKVAKLLFATDIVLLGSMNDCDLNGVPKFFNYLTQSTYNMPTDVLFTDHEISYIFNEKGELTDQVDNKLSVSSGCDWGNKNVNGYYDGGLFYSIGCNSAQVMTSSCINLRRICEIGVGLDNMSYINDITKKITSEDEELDHDNADFYLMPDGFISYDDIVDFDYRSMFATMNGNGLKTKINKNNGVKEYDFRHLCIDNFDGSLEEIMALGQRQKDGREWPRKIGNKAKYRFNHKLEKPDTDYLTFRMGDRPYYYDGESLVVTEKNKNTGTKKFTMPKYQNSFYFYFGLKEGKTAIDVFNENYNGECATKADEEESIPYEALSNSWCVSDSDKGGSYDHSTFDGYLKLNLEKIPLPCTAILNSRSNSAITYTVMKKNDDENDTTVQTKITYEDICFYGDGIDTTSEEFEKNLKDSMRYYFLYENSSSEASAFEDGVKNCQMLTNGEYDLIITDAEGDIHSYVIIIKNNYLTFEDVENKFAQPNNVLRKYYADGVQNHIIYANVAQSPSADEIKVEEDKENIGVPTVTRDDKEMNRVVNPNVIQGKHIKLNGTICIYDIIFDDDYVEDVLIEVEPYDKSTDENGNKYYTDSDFWEGGTDQYNSWYEQKMLNIKKDGKINHIGIINTSNGKEYVESAGVPSQYFYYQDLDTTNGLKKHCYVIKCPKGNVAYLVRVTQLCQDEHGWYKSQNSIERIIRVEELTPYKLYINDVDYDIIKNFKTGYPLVTSDGMQTSTNPINKGAYNFNSIEGWLEISNMKNDLYDWEANEEFYGKNSWGYIDPTSYTYNSYGYTKDNNGNYTVGAEPVEEDYEEYNDFATDHAAWSENSRILENRLEFISQMKSAFWLQCENESKTITYQVRTDDVPWDVYTMWNGESVSVSDDNYNETDSIVKDESREGWIYSYGHETTIEDIRIPTITAFDSKDFGIAEDNYRIEKMMHTYSTDKTKCFAQDNVAKNSKDSGSVSIKPPYLVACVNSTGITKPDNLKKEVFFGEYTNEYGIQKYMFGTEGGSQQKVNDGTYQFFGFHLIDKIFTADIVCWSYINNIPYYLPWYDYDEEATDANRLGYTIKTDGIMSGIIKNGITNTKPYVTDFETKSIFEKDSVVKTFNGASEDDIPTKRCILYSDEEKDLITGFKTGEGDNAITYSRDANSDFFDENNDDKAYYGWTYTVKNEDGTEEIKTIYTDTIPNEKDTTVDIFTKDGNTLTQEENDTKVEEVLNDLTYQDYRHVNKNKISDNNQYKSVPNRQGELDFMDAEGNCSLQRTLCGNMRINLLSTTLNDAYVGKKRQNGLKFSTLTGENGETSLTLRVNCQNADSDENIKYYLFHVSRKYYVCGDQSDKGEDKLLWYPLNAFEVKTSVTPYKYKLQCDCTGDDETKWVWDGSMCKAQHIFNKNTTLKKFKDEDDVQADLVYEKATSNIQWEDSEGETKYENTTGYGNTGIFENLVHEPYFVVAATENGNRTISPVYDFTTVYYVVGLVEINGQKALRVALVYVLYKHEGMNKEYQCNKRPRNYYLTQFDFTMSYAFSFGSTLVTNDGITYEKTNSTFVKKENAETGDSYVEGPDKDGNYTITTLTGGSLNENGTSPTQSGSSVTSSGTYYYATNVYDEETDDYVDGWQSVTFNNEGNIIEGNKTVDKPTSGTDITNGGSFEITDANGNKTYKNYTWSNKSSETVSYNPLIPYFMRYNDKSLTNEEYNSLKTLFSMAKTNPLKYTKNCKVYVTDVTGLKHVCYLHNIITENTDWENNVLFVPIHEEDKEDRECDCTDD